jgi:hypothetical protein
MSAISQASGSVNPYTYYSQPISGKMEVPVMASQSLYANFEFVQGVPSSEGGLSLDRLKVIDSLLAQINAHRQAGTAPVKRDEVNLSNPDQAIADLSAQVHDMQKNSSAFQGWGSPKGLVFDLSA